MQLNFPQKETKIIDSWKEKNIFAKSLQKKRGDFVFYEGPPTANAKPGVHHVLARVFKDIVCRYKTMQGFRVLRKAGWDVHGLPVELSVEKELGLNSKKEIEKHGIDKFNHKCQQSVWRYAKEWAGLTERIGYWLDLENPYITGDPFYMESVFHIIKKIWEKGLLKQDYKVVPYCPRCGTGLSSHEVALGYKKIREPAIYIKFKVQSPKSKVQGQELKDETYLLVWTTTPWTLSANVAIAVNPKIDYWLVKKDNEYLILAKERKEVLGENFEIIKEFKGKEIVGLFYNPLFSEEEVLSPKEAKNIYKVLSADFVSTEEGTGIVHIAPAFGEEDMALWREQFSIFNFQFPKPVDEEGKFKPEVKKWAGMFVKDADPLIIQHFQAMGKLFKIEEYEHDYPFCWRCGTPLLYYAKKSWFIKTTQIKQKLINNNQKINWMPAYIKEGRFGEWLNDLKDWSLSRERYWGTPLPIWQCQIGKNQKSCDNVAVIGSREDLLKQKFSTNKYFILRHGEAVSNAENFYCSFPEKRQSPLTEKGKKQIEKAARMLKNEKIDIIFSSDILRAKETAQIVGRALGIHVQYDKRLTEIDTGDFNGKPVEEGDGFFNPQNKLKKAEVLIKKYNEGFPKGENYFQVGIRMLDFIKETEKKYKNKNILIVSHELPLTMLKVLMLGWKEAEVINHKKELSISTGQLHELEYKVFPYNSEGKLDFHRPHIDEIEFFCQKCGGLMKRVTEVIDCWFDSGAMPFAQGHWPFAQNQKSKIKNQKLRPPKLFPADYICEGIDQTRGWFYTLLAISTLLGFGPPYKNVISLGHILDEKGEKMSKSKGNVVDPWYIVEKYGADALRWYSYTVNQPGDAKLFNERDIDQCLKKFILTFWNCYIFLKTYWREGSSLNLQVPASKNLLDRWVISKLNRLVQDSTQKLESYDITGAGRLIEDFVINDLSLWYIRRSRKRFQQPKNAQEASEAFSTLCHALFVLSRLTAPFVPFISETIYQGLVLDNKKESVHLEDWPKPEKKVINKELEEQMETARGIVKIGLKLRNDIRIKVRQPLQKLKIKNLPRTRSFASVRGEKSKMGQDFLDLIKEELNVKEVELVKEIEPGDTWAIEESQGLAVALNKEINKELEQEGIIRDLTRQIQQMRKKANCKPQDKIVVYYFGNRALIEFLQKRREDVALQTRIQDFVLKKDNDLKINAEKDIQINSQNLWLGIKIVVK